MNPPTAPMMRSLTKNPQQKISRVSTSENPLINTPVGAFGIHLHGELPLKRDLSPETFRLEGDKKRLILFTVFPCSANNHSDPSIRFINDLFKNFFNDLLRESHNDNVNQKIIGLKKFLSRERIKYGIETAYKDLKYCKEEYDKLSTSVHKSKLTERNLKKLEEEMRNTYTYIKYILDHPDFLVDINIYDERNPDVPNKHYDTTKEIMESSTSYIEGTIDAFKVRDTYSVSKIPDTSIPPFRPLIIPKGTSINLLTQIIREKEKSNTSINDYITIRNDNGKKYELTLEQLCDYYFDKGYTILIGYDTSCNIFTRKDEVITKHADIVSATDRYVNNPEISHPLSSEDSVELRAFLDSGPLQELLGPLEDLLAVLEREPYVNFLRPSKGGSLKIKNRKISKTTVKKRRGKKRRRTKRR
jgi:hypothetical protein